MISRRSFLSRSTLATAGALVVPQNTSHLLRADGTAAVVVPTPHHNDPHLHLFVDDFEIESRDYLTRVLNKPEKHPQPVLVRDRPWEGDRVQAWGTVIQEPDGLLRIWYFAMNTRNMFPHGVYDGKTGSYCYAESRDGIHWEKPNLRIFEFEGSTDNNIFYCYAPDKKNLVEVELARRGTGLPALNLDGKQIGVVNNMDGIGSVLRDDSEPDPNKRYKLVANMQDHRMWAPYHKGQYPNVTKQQVQQARSVFGQYIDTSPDGIHWTRRPRRVLSAVADYMLVARDHRNQHWWLNERMAGQGGRNAALRTSQDLIHWTDPEMIFDNGADSEYGKLFEWHGGITPFNYGNLNLGLLEKWCNTGFGETCELVVGRDGQKWNRVAPGTPFLDIGPEGAFDRLLAYPTHNAPCLVGDRLLIFYTGGAPTEDDGRGQHMSIGVASVRLDRFAGLAHRRRTPGQLVTKPLEVPHRGLEINAEPLYQSSVRLAIERADGSPIDGYGLEQSQIRLDPMQARVPARWKNKPDLAELQGQQVRLRFEIKQASLYAYRFFEPA